MMPRAKMKVSVPALPHATDLLTHLLNDGRTKLGADTGASYGETIAGYNLIAYRLECGGVAVREVVG
ncbi:MAG: hypothetical protein H7Y60_09700 [Rhodospirillaceae bacterium]|nr:hypothetical protein [Rhodospirillales bacterium]